MDWTAAEDGLEGERGGAACQCAPVPEWSGELGAGP